MMVFHCDACGFPIEPIEDLIACNQCGAQYEAVHPQQITVSLTRRQVAAVAILPAIATAILGSAIYGNLPPKKSDDKKIRARNMGRLVGIVALAGVAGWFATVLAFPD